MKKEVILYILLFSLLSVVSSTAEATDAMMVYFSSGSTSQTPEYRTWNGSLWSSSSTANDIGAQASNWYVLRECPTRNEKILGVRDASGHLNLLVWNGSSWGNLLEVSTYNSSLDVKTFDITYEQSSGDALVVFRDNTSSTIPKYVVWNGSSWSSEFDVSMSTSGSGYLNWFRLASKPNSDEIILGIQDSSSDISFHVWNGSSWGNSIVVEWATEATTAQCFDIAYEQSSGNGMIVWAGNSNDNYYRIWNGSIWSSSNTVNMSGITTASSMGYWIKLAAKPNSNEIMMGVIDAVTTPDIDVVIWNGTSWGNAREVTAATVSKSTRSFDVAYEQSSGEGIIVYSTNTATPVYDTWNGAWSGPFSANPTNDGAIIHWVALSPDPSSDDLMLVTSDANNDINVQKWNGSSWSAIEEKEDDSSNLYECFAVSYQIYVPDLTAPADIVNSTASNSGLNDGEIKLEWTAPGDDGTTGTVAGYLVKYSSMDVITTSGFDSAATYYHSWSGFVSGGNPESQTVEGLNPGTTYWFAIQGYDEAGHYGVWKSSNDPGGYNVACSTSAQDLDPQVPQNLSAVSGGATQINLSWTANTDIDFNQYELVASSWSETLDFSFSTLTVLTTYYHTSLDTNNTYYYKIRAMDNTDHYSAYSSTISAYPIQVPPAKPTGFDGLALSTSSIKWSWTDNATNEDGYRIISDTDGIMGTLGQVFGGTTYYTEGNLAPNTSYYRYAEAYNGAGTSSSSSKILYTLPDKPANLQAVSVTTGSINLSWNAGAGGAYRYGLAKSTDNFNTNISSFIVFSNNLTVNTTTADNLLTGTTYYFRVWAYNEDGRESAWDGPVSTRTNAMVNYMDIVINEIMYNPQGTEGVRDWVEIYNRSAKDINLTNWKFFDGDGTTKHTFNFFQGGSTIPAGGYAVLVDSATAFLNDYSDNPSSSTWMIIDTTVQLTDPDTVILYYKDSSTLVSSVTYSKTWNNNEEGKSIEKKSPQGAENDPANWQASSSAEGTPGARNSCIPDTFPPANITDLTAITGDIEEGTIRLEWTAPGDDGVTGVLGSGSQYKLWASTNPVYFEISESGGGTGATAPVSWQKVISTSNVRPNDLQSYTVTGLFPGTTYYFAIRTKDPLDNWSVWPGTSPGVNTQSYAIAYDTHPAKPSGLVLTPGYTKISIDWNDNTESDISEYRVYFGSSTSGTYDHADSPKITTASSLMLTNLTNFTTYYIAVKAVDANGLESELSIEKDTYPALEAPSWITYQAVSGWTDRILWKWNYIPDASAYRVYSSTNGILKELNQSETEWTETNLDANTQCFRYVVGVDPDLVEGYRAQTVSRHTFAGKPENLSSTEQTEDSITLTWDPPSSGESANQYKVERDGQDIATIPETTYKDTGLSSWREYTYRVKSLNSDGLTDAVSSTEYVKYKTTYLSTPKPERKFIVPGKEIKFGTEAEEVRIFDTQGKEIIKKNKGSESFITWDGKSGGSPVGSGPYIYQIKTKDGKKKYGTIIIAK